MKSKSNIKNKTKTKEPFPSEKTPDPPQQINPSEEPKENLRDDGDAYINTKSMKNKSVFKQDK